VNVSGPLSNSDAQQHLRVDELMGNLRHSSTRGGALMIASHAIQFVIGVTGTAILARMLRPADFGYLAMVATLTNFVASFRDLGLPMAAVHKQELSHEQASGLFWVNVLTSFAIAALVAASALPLAWFYSEPKLVAITLVMAGGILASSLGMVHSGLLRRRMNFAAVAVVEVSAMLVGLCVGVGSALGGAGYWALVFQQLSIYLTQTIAALLLCRWRPTARARAATLADPELRSMLRYGRNESAARILTYAGRNTDGVLVGYFWGPSILGLYQKAYQWSITPFYQIFGPLMPVAVSSFSRLQDDPGRYRLYVRTAMLGLFSATLPATALLIIAAEPVVLLLLGRQWVDAIPLFRVLAVGAYFTTFSLVTRWLYLAEGRTGEQLRWAIVSAPLTILGVVAGLRWGAIGVAKGFAIATSLLAIPGLLYCLRRSPIKRRDFVSAAWRPAIASILAAGVTLAVRLYLVPDLARPSLQFAVDAAAYTAAYVAFWVGMPRGRAEAGNVLRHLRLLLPAAE
jgi:PST family polysaccharide transporter